MAYRVEKNGESEDIVWDGFENGIAASPHKGIANIQAGNISSELGEVTTAFSRTKQTQTTITNGTLTASVSDGTTLLASSSPLLAGQWINISASTITMPATVNTLVIGGGGAGGSGTGSGGGGGAGEYHADSAFAVSVQAYAITIGTGGVPGGAAATSTVFSTITAVGGGAGQNDANGGTGASGGGAGANTGSHTGGTATAGNAGGDSIKNGGNVAAGGGGGAGAVGGNASASGLVPGAGGNGTANTISGASVTYAGGGGGYSSSGGVGGAGGTGGGGAGASPAGVAGAANKGAGGGGSNGSSTGGAGGSGVVVISYPAAGSATGAKITATGGTITTSGGNTIHTFTTSGTFTITSITLATGNYYVSYQDTNGKIKLSRYFDPTSTVSVITHGTSGTATFTTTPTFASPVAKAVEKYNDGTSDQYRYYVLDSQGLVWVYDTALYASSLASSGVGMTWFLPDTSVAYFTGSNPSGIAILDGWLLVFGGAAIYIKSTINLGDTTSNSTTYVTGSFTIYSTMPNSGTTHFAFTGHQGRCYYTDGNYIGSIFPDSSINSGGANIQSFGSYTASTTTGTLTTVINGAVPVQYDSSYNILRVPVVFLVPAGGTVPAAISAGTVYWIKWLNVGVTFEVYAASTGGSALDIQTGSVGTQYFNTFYPVDVSKNTYVTQGQRVNLPPFEAAQCLVEVGNTVLIGCKGNVVYPWNQTDATPSSIITLPEGNVQSMLTVNQMAYMFAGNQGNVYITDGSVASLVTNVPDYVAGVPGSPGTYIESTYTWGGVMYLRGRVYFSILDQSTTKAGNCGGVWSFVPTQNLYIGQDTGLALRLEAQNSYNTYNGTAPLLIPNEAQTGKVPLYWSPWYSSVTSPTYGIDYSNGGTDANFPCVIELDAVPVGTMLNQRTPQQIEYKLGAPLDTGATVTAKYRLNITDAWTACNTFNTDSSKLSGYVAVNFQKAQWVQLQFTLTPITSSADTNSYIRFREARLR